MPAHPRLSALLLVLCSASGAYAATGTEFLLANEFLFADPHPDAHFSGQAELGSRFRSAFAASFSSRVIQLGPQRLLQPDEPAVVVVPRIAAVRLSHEVVAGTIHNFEASIAGSVSAVDPWTDTVLFAATRMESARVKLGSSALTATDADLEKAFQEAFEKWMRACFAEFETKLVVFRLTGVAVRVPAEFAKAPGGVWPFGLEHGLRTGLILTGAAGHAARVTAAFDQYSEIVDTADGSRPISPGETYSLTVAQEPAERREPRVSVSWLGPAPDVPAGSSADPLSIDAATGIFVDYLSKNSSLRLLPPGIQDPVEQSKFDEATRAVSLYTGLVQQELMTIHQGALVQIAKENPEFRIALFATASYSGIASEKATVEHRYRATMGAALLARHGDGDVPLYGLVQVFLKNEHLGRTSEIGIREVDNRAAIFTTWRNAVIELAREVLASGKLRGVDASVVVDGKVGADRALVWPPGLRPDSHAPLLWLRPAGVIEPAGAEKTNSYYRLQQPSLGYLTEAVANAEKLKAGDILRYARMGTRAELLGLRFEIAPKDAAPLLDAAVVRQIVAGSLAEILGREIVTVDGPARQEGALDGIPVLLCYVSSLSESANPAGLSFGGQWRLQLLPSAGSPPVAKLGIEVTSQVSASEAASLKPLDQTAYRIQYFVKALDQVSSALRAEGFDRALKTLDFTQ